ncbi:hypothetical protein PROFUN_05117 [Planoprotostelium fungivorum]|uniref:Uncharacterized protein n=1 Tax=Planoprotostelium fungivorum TaxID=1890364 RepID=A0A2P6NRZ1_9EUKA|nr:hypothetical protein PROFUN_05117 [Planoprotostelium fungivorum]
MTGEREKFTLTGMEDVTNIDSPALDRGSKLLRTEDEDDNIMRSDYGSTVVNDDDTFDPYSSLLRSRRKGDDEIKGLKKRKLRKFYQEQNELIDDLLSTYVEDEEKKKKENFRIKVAIYGSVAVNICLFGLQLFAAIQSKSLSILATMADSFMDLLSGIILLFAERASKKSANIKYPVGKARIETAGIIVFAVLMSALALELIIQAVESLIEKKENPQLEPLPIACVAASLFAKILLFIYCYSLRHNPSVALLATDHRNDLFVNSFGLGAAILASRTLWWIDPAGAIVVALIILRSWASTAYEHAQLIVGVTADPNFISKITYLGLTHDKRILKMDTARAYTVGNNFFVEVDIVLDPELKLREAHDIGESLQMKLENLPNVERAFVHLDYETDHKPEHQRYSRVSLESIRIDAAEVPTV